MRPVGLCTPGQSRLALLVLLLAAQGLRAIEQDQFRPAHVYQSQAGPQNPRPALSNQNSIQNKATRAIRRYQAFVNGAAKASKWIHVGSGFWLFVSTPVSVISSGFALRPAELVLCVYLGAFGFMLAGCELPLLRGLFEAYFRFLFTTPGRMLFICFVASMAWTIKHVGIISKGLLLFNALLSAYVYNSSSVVLKGEDQRAMGEVGDTMQKLKEQVGEMKSIANVFGLKRMLGGTGGSRGSSPRSPPQQSPYSDTSTFSGSPYSSSGRNDADV